MSVSLAPRSGPWDEVSAVTDPLLERGDAPKIIIIAVSTAGSILLILNVVLITCYLIRRRKKCMEEGEWLVTCPYHRLPFLSRLEPAATAKVSSFLVRDTCTSVHVTVD